MFSYKTDASDAAAMAAVWYGLAGRTPDPQGLAWWTKQIQQDGSQPAFDNFTKGIAKDTPANATILQQNVAKYKTATGLAPYQPSANVPQFPGTNHKTLIAEAQEPVGNFLKNIAPAVALIPGVGPLVSAALAAAGQAIIPGANLGDAVKAGVTGAAEGAGVSALSGITGLSGVIGGGSSAAGSAASAIPDAATMDPGALAGAADATGGVNAATMAPGALASAADAGSGSSGILSGLTGSSGLTTLDILKGIGGGVEAYTKQANDAATLAEKKREFDATNALSTQNTAVTEGQNAVATQNKLNTAPLADKSQYLLNASMSAPPTAFKPRDYTQPGGTNNLATPASGGAAAQLAANQAASSSYTPGAGGVDTSTLQLLLSKLKGSGSAFGNMPTTSPTGTG